MAYAVKYRITQATQSGTIQYLDILEDAYSGAVIEYPAITLNLQYIPSSDDAFEPIYASQLSVSIDVTDDVDNMPDFTTLNDKKYLCKLYYGAAIKWQGWALSDEVLFAFTTGRKEISFNAICGLGLLKDIDFDTASTDFSNNILHYLTNSIIKVGFPTAPNILTSCSIYSATMDNRTGSPENEPWSQSYMALNNFVDVQENNTGVLRNKYSCLDVVHDILYSWGCRIFMCNGEWNIIQINQMFEDTRYYTRYDSTGTLIDSGTFTGNKNIPDDVVFVNGNQTKIYKKGYNNFIGFKQIEFQSNMLYNPLLKQYTGNDALLWTETVGGTGYVAIKTNQDKNVNAFILALGNVVTGSLAQVESNTLIPIFYGDSPKLQFRIYNTEFTTNVGGTVLPHCLIRLILVTAVDSYYLNDANEWAVYTIGVNAFYQVNDKGNNTLVNLEEIPPVPNTGTLSFGIMIGGSGVATQPALIAGDFEVSISSQFKSVLMTASINDDETYRKDAVFPHGYNIDTDFSGATPSFMGAVTNLYGEQMQGWYMFERFSVDNFDSLAQLMFKNYINMFRKNIINIDGSISGELDAMDVFTFDDLDPAQISVTGNKYILGNSTFYGQINELQSTFLEIDNIPQDVAITTIFDNGVDPGISFSVAGASTTSPGACALTSYTLTKYSTQFLPVVGDVIYNNATLTTVFPGSGIWWKFFIPYYNTVRSYRISASGVILEANTC